MTSDDDITLTPDDLRLDDDEISHYKEKTIKEIDTSLSSKGADVESTPEKEEKSIAKKITRSTYSRPQLEHKEELDILEGKTITFEDQSFGEHTPEKEVSGEEAPEDPTSKEAPKSRMSKKVFDDGMSEVDSAKTSAYEKKRHEGRGYDRKPYAKRTYGTTTAPIEENNLNYDDSVNLEDRIKEDLKISFPGKGILEITPSGFGFLRPSFSPSQDDIYVSQSQIRKFWLRPGDEVEGLIRPPKDNEKYHGLLKIEKINGVSMTEEESKKRVKFNDMTSLYPDRLVRLETENDILSTRIIDILSPIGFGQRGLIVSPPKAGKTTLLKQIANGITENHPEAHLIAVLIGERPEEVTDLTRSIKAEVVSSHFDQSPRDQIRAGEIGLERAKRLVEMGKDVIILLDSVTRLARAYNFAVNPSGRTLSGGFDPAALYPAKKFLGAARNCEEGGSLTIIGTALVSTESRMDDLIYEEFKGTGNMELHLDREYANKRIFPAIDIEKSGTRHDELLLDKDIMEKTAILRRMMALLDKEERLTALTEKLKKTKNNKDFLKEMKTT